ncbi:MAG TPA: hypothetical protein VES38_06835 [Methylotenera sp.]|nr:hypothetical protein [Methylotenera sp.]
MQDFPSVQISYFPLKGGLNLVTPPLSMPDGMCRDSLNFEVDIDGGYRRVAGYERLDGRPQPSDAIFYTISATFTGAVVYGNVITGATSGATATAIAATADLIAFTKLTGTFVSGENITVSAVIVAATTSTAISGSAPDQLTQAQYTNLAADIYRADIAAVPGSGSILGVHRYNSVVYAFRNNAGGTAAAMYKSSSSGWTLVNLGYEVSFSNANTSVQDADTLTQGGVTATINRVVVQTGTLASGVNTGRLIISAPAGGNFAVGAATSTGGGALTLSGAESIITLAPGGRYEFVNYNFGGGAGSIKMYGVSGVHRAFEFDGTTLVPISTGMANDTPKHITVHVNHLFLSFDGSAQNSGVGAPYVWTIITGAGEIAMGDTITGFMPMIGSNLSAALAIFTSNKTSMLYGNSTADFSLVTLSFEVGGFDYTMQNIAEGYVLDALGVRQIAATDAFGNFSSGQITKNIRPFIEARVTRSIGSCIVRLRDQYRILFNDRYALHVTMQNGEFKGAMPIQYAHTMTVMSSYESNSGEEFVYAGDTDGFVYRMERGTSFDGEPIIAYVNLAFSFMKNPRLRKRYRKAVYEITGGSYAEMDASYELGYGSTEIEQGTTSDIATSFGNVNWDRFVWDSFFWDGRTLLPAEQDITGSAENISLIIRSTSDLFRPFTVNSAIIHYTVRRLLR